MSVGESMQDLISALTEALDTAKAQGAQAFSAGEFEQAQQAANQGKAVASILEGAKRLQQQWEALGDVEAAKSKEWSVPVGGDSPHDDIIFPVLYVLEEMGSKAPAVEVLDKVESLLEEKLTPQEYAELSEAWGGPLHDMEKKLADQMLRRGLIHGNSPKGVWHITPQGRIALLEQQG